MTKKEPNETANQSTSMREVRAEPQVQRVPKAITLEIGYRASGNGDPVPGVPPSIIRIQRPSESEFSRELDATIAMLKDRSHIIYWSVYVKDWYRMTGRNKIKPTVSCSHKNDRVFYGADLASLTSIARLARDKKLSKKFELQA